MIGLKGNKKDGKEHERIYKIKTPFPLGATCGRDAKDHPIYTIASRDCSYRNNIIIEGIWDQPVVAKQLIIVHPETSQCHSEWNDESPGKTPAKRFFVVPLLTGLLRMTIEKRGFRIDTR